MPDQISKMTHGQLVEAKENLTIQAKSIQDERAIE